MQHLLNLFGLIFLLFGKFPIMFSILKRFWDELLNNFVMNLIFPTYVNFTSLLREFFFILVRFLFWWLWLKLLYHNYYYELFVLLSISFPFSVLFMGYPDKRLVRYLTATSLCSRGRYESLWVIISVVLGFL